MWFKLSQFILRNRLLILGLILSVSVYLGYFAVTNIKVDNKYGTMLPKNSKPKKDYDLLKTLFGGNESLLVFAIQTEDFYSLEKFNAWYDLGERVSEFDAVDSVFSEAHLYQLVVDSISDKFTFDKVVKSKPKSQEELDSLKTIIRGNPFFEGLLYNDTTDCSLMMLFINEEIMSDMKKAKILFEVEAVALEYEDLLGAVRVSGMPHIRVAVGKKLQGELLLFIALSIGITSLLLFIFFRSLKIVLICNVVVFVGVIWSLGSIGAFDFQLSILMVLIPPLIIVISIPNCIFLINKFHQEIIEHGNKAKALSRVIQKIGNATFLTNLTTALGFSTFIFTNSERLSEFGLITSINILVVFLLSITILPIILSYSKIPKPKHLKHLEKQWLHLAVEKLEYLSLYKRKYVYGVTFIILGVAITGTTQIKATGNITGDLPQNDQITTDLKFIEKNFGGSIPFEILIDTKKEKTFFTRFQEIEDLQIFLREFEFVSKNAEDKTPRRVFSKSLSASDGIKALNMAYSRNNPDKYKIPSLKKLKLIQKKLDTENNTANGFLDSTQTITRISMQIIDIGSYEIQEIIDSISPILDEVINPGFSEMDSLYQKISKSSGKEKDIKLDDLYDAYPTIREGLIAMFTRGDKDKIDEYDYNEELIYELHSKVGFNDSLKIQIDKKHWDITYTGTAVVASNGTQYLVVNLFISLAIAIVLIGILMALLFRSWRMVLVSLLPNFIPLLVTSGIMGYFGIPIKPSSLLVFSIAFGISVDDTIHFLAKFRQELKLHEHDLRRCILVALRETGVSMIYTSIVLFFGFGIFVFSQFGGTQALGILVSLTLLVAMFTNLLILPSLLLGMHKNISNKALAEPLLQLFDEEEDIELEHLEIEKTLKKYREEDSKADQNASED